MNFVATSDLEFKEVKNTKVHDTIYFIHSMNFNSPALFKIKFKREIGVAINTGNHNYLVLGLIKISASMN